MTSFRAIRLQPDLSGTVDHHATEARASSSANNVTPKLPRLPLVLAAGSLFPSTKSSSATMNRQTWPNQHNEEPACLHSPSGEPQHDEPFIATASSFIADPDQRHFTEASVTSLPLRRSTPRQSPQHSASCPQRPSLVAAALPKPPLLQRLLRHRCHAPKLNHQLLTKIKLPA